MTNILRQQTPFSSNESFDIRQDSVDGLLGNVAVMGVRVLPNGDTDWGSAATILFADKAVNQGPGRETLSLQSTLETAVEELKAEPTPKGEYSLDEAVRDRPYTHYTHSGNIFQMLRFGIQSGNFKNRIKPMREGDQELEEISTQMSSMRFRKGGSYQGKDSISLGLYDDHTTRSHDLVLLVDPTVKVFGLQPDERDPSSGYGHGISPKAIEGDFEIGNPTAYQIEVLAPNIIPPSKIKGVVLHEKSSIISSLRDITRNNVILYSQAKLHDPATAKEDLLANSRLIAALSGSTEGSEKIDEIAEQIDTLPAVDLIKQINVLQKGLLQDLVGPDTQLSELSLRTAIQYRFGVPIITVA